MAKYINRMKEKMRERAKADIDKRRGGSSTLRIPDGMDVEFYKVDSTRAELDIVPYIVSVDNRPDGVEKGELWHTRRYFVHRNVGADEQSYICPKATLGKPCPICEYAAAQRKRGADKEELKELKPKARDLFNVVDLDDGGKFKVWDVSSFLFGEKLQKELTEAEDSDNDAFADLEDGRTLKLRFEKKSFNKNEFYAIDRIDFKPRKPYKDKILDKVVDLDKMLVILSYEELERIFYMEDGPTDRSGEEEDEPKPRRSREREVEEEEEAPRSRRAKRDEDADEEDEPRRGRKRSRDEDEEEDAEEEPRSRRSRSRAEEEDDEEEEAPRRSRSRRDEEEEEEDEPKPRGRSRRAEPEPEEDEEEEEKPRRSSRKKQEQEDDEEEAPKERRSRKSRNDSDEDCPGGGTFGKDNDKFDECDACKKWGECNRALQG